MIDALIGVFYAWLLRKLVKFFRFVIWLARLTKPQLWYFLAHVHLILSNAALDFIKSGAIRRDSRIGRGLKRAAMYSSQQIQKKFREITAERDAAKKLLPKPSGD